MTVSALEAAGNNRWRVLGENAGTGFYRMCANYAEENVCNWMVAEQDQVPFCSACGLNDTIPDLSDGANRTLWYRLEVAKRRLLYTLYQLGLAVVSRLQDPGKGLAFRFLASQNETTGNEHCRVVTGHETGLITINIAEADPVARVTTREQMNERYRTLLGHFRHEIGHYYWDRLIQGTAWLAEYRAHFGDERLDYQEKLRHYYTHGAPPDWSGSYVSEYASAHPWEDWAETWAHYLHIVDTLDTAHDGGVAAGGSAIHSPFDKEPDHDFRQSVDEWSALTVALNSLNRSMGQGDLYPFSLSPKVVDKLCFVHRVVADATPSQTAAVG